ncbi:TetR/AcrR family transcriptional regulator [Alsobacter sp. SYSU M60028]|uniref:TetR/AcrR family transcriptional regulator n=1 Tax=Alsobacter ponti TaxID=2962936 RepID=A0ABT1L6K5_9HYPH|nr:TetR/AcrR family transcriptional regulator [Alsobacter ponti]MCP8937030.1 TetR/AcrR family transcriptional regulator [Alsobacter ponti]
MARKADPKSAAGKAGSGGARGSRAASASRTERDDSAGGTSRSARDRVIDALMALAEERRWDEIGLTDIAEAAGVSLAELRDLFPSKGAILGGFSRRIDRQVLEGTNDDLVGEPVRERLFDVMMRRLDALAPYRESLRRIMRDMSLDPLHLAALNQMQLNSQRFMLAAAGIDTEGPVGAVKLQGAVLVWGRTLRTWLDDDDPGLARTMASLDRDLRRGGEFVRGLTDLTRMASPFCALFRRVAEDGRRLRQRRRARRGDEDRDRGLDDEDYARA